MHEPVSDKIVQTKLKYWECDKNLLKNILGFPGFLCHSKCMGKNELCDISFRFIFMLRVIIKLFAYFTFRRMNKRMHGDLCDMSQSFVCAVCGEHTGVSNKMNYMFTLYQFFIMSTIAVLIFRLATKLFICGAQFNKCPTLFQNFQISKYPPCKHYWIQNSALQFILKFSNFKAIIMQLNVRNFISNFTSLCSFSCDIVNTYTKYLENLNARTVKQIFMH